MLYPWPHLFCLLPLVKELLASPKLSHKRAFSDDVSQLSPAQLEPRAPQSPQGRQEPLARSSLCINGSHVYGEDSAPRAPPGSAPLPVPPRRQDEPLGFTPLHPEPQEVPWGLGSLERAQQRDEPRFIPSPPSLALQEELKVSTKAVTLSNHLGRARMEESKASQAAAPPAISTEPGKDRAPEDSRKEDKKAKGGFFHHGGTRSDAGDKGDRGTPVHAPAAGEERSKSSGWFGSKEPKESPQKPRSVQGAVEVQAGDSCPKFPSPGCSWDGSGKVRAGKMLPCSEMSQKEENFPGSSPGFRNHLCWMWAVFSSVGREGFPPWRGFPQQS